MIIIVDSSLLSIPWDGFTTICSSIHLLLGFGLLLGFFSIINKATMNVHTPFLSFLVLVCSLLWVNT